ncbi:MAG: hydrogenase expression/formation protein [Alphaproteobacteria bacterium]|nr:hydrogenase expression/formation protein [Alphaproteobacteria bacterium]MDE2013973.1 hydrogenase expression/formation protein [Alphaproteobacteria bacterium]MDE2074283.1 hydrogenase expression/formation protein [Alphaproteobacteria bacterium]
MNAEPTDGGFRNGPLTGPLTGLAEAVFGEIAARLQALADSGEESVIDLRSLPLTPGDRRELEERLGHGEVCAGLDVGGLSEVWECGYAGVWWVRHLGEDGMPRSEHIEIAAVPAILVTHAGDIASAAARLQRDAARPAKEDTRHA